MTLFVAAMGASNALFAQARPSEPIADWIGPHVDMLASFGGAPKAAVCDNRKAAVTHPDRYEPGLNRSRRAFAKQGDRFLRQLLVVGDPGGRPIRATPWNAPALAREAFG